MAAVASLFIVLSLSILITRIASIALSYTGLSREAARFQARSAFTGVGFTTREAESIVHHPVRRRIVLLLMLLGNVGIATVVASLILSFVSLNRGEGWLRLGTVVGGCLILAWIAHSKVVDSIISRAVEWPLRKYTKLDVRDYASLLKLREGYSVAELQVREDDWLANRRLDELQLNKEGILILGVDQQDGDWIGAPRGSYVIRPGDVLTIYGRASRMSELDERSAGGEGDQAHLKSVAEQDELNERDEQTRIKKQ